MTIEVEINLIITRRRKTRQAKDMTEIKKRKKIPIKMSMR